MPKSPRQVRKEVQEAVTEQVRDLPINAVRLAMFGIGRALLLGDRLTRDYKDIKTSGVGPVLTRWRDDAEHVAAQVVGRVVEGVAGTAEPEPEIPVARPPRKVNTSLAADPEFAVGKSAARPDTARPDTARPNTARVNTARKVAAEPVTAPEPENVVVTAPETPSAPQAKPAAESIPEPIPVAVPKPAAARPEPEPVAADALPVPGYDGLTIASVRARLRRLNAEQVSLLHDYEQANAARADFVRMYENRLAKLAEQG